MKNYFKDLILNYESSTAKGSLSDIDKDICKQLQTDHLPNIFKILSYNPELKTTIWQTIKSSYTTHVIPRPTKELIFSVLAKSRNCEYCHINHTLLACHFGLPEDQLVFDLDQIPQLNNAVHQAMIEFSLKMTKTPEDIINEDYQKLKKAGLNEEEITDLITFLGVAEMLINLALYFKVPIELSTQEKFNELKYYLT